MTPHDPLEDRLQHIERRVTDVEDDVADLRDGPWLCVLCDCPYNSRSAAERCCED